MTKLKISNKAALSAAFIILLVAGLMVQSVSLKEKNAIIQSLHDERAQLFSQLKAVSEDSFKACEHEAASAAAQEPVVIYKARKAKDCNSVASDNDDSSDYVVFGEDEQTGDVSSVDEQSVSHKGRVLVSLDVGVGPTDVGIESQGGSVVAKPSSGLMGGVSACYFLGEDFCIGAGAQTNSTFTLKLGKEF